MYVKSILKRGKSHELACQDSIFNYENDEYLIAAVFDGCSEFEDSHFASNFLKKTFKNEVEKKIKEIPAMSTDLFNMYFNTEEESEGIELVAKNILNSFFKKIDLIRNEINLTPDDFASTCIFLFYNKVLEQGIVYAFGDGYISLNEQKIIIDHNNKPKYITLFWRDLVNGQDLLYKFLESYEQIWRFSKIDNVIISTDGILSFSHPELNKIEAQEYLLKDKEINGKNIIHQNSFFEKKYNILISSGWKHTDDLGIIRICSNE